MSKEQAKQPAEVPERVDPAEVAKIFAEVAQRSSKVFGDYMKRQTESQKSLATDEFGIAKAFMDLWQRMLANPARLAELQMSMMRDYMTLWQNSWLKMMGQPVQPVAEPKSSDSCRSSASGISASNCSTTIPPRSSAASLTSTAI